MKLRIGILGTRGIPNQYGGFEQVAEQLSVGLAGKGHQVAVYNSHNHPYKEKDWKGVQVIHCYDPEHKIGTAGQFIYDLNCIRDAGKRNFDVILMLGYTSSSVWRKFYPPKALIIFNMDGLEWKRTKYSKPVRRFLEYAEKLAVLSSPYLIADSPEIKKYLDDKYDVQTKYIAYGAEPFLDADENLLREYSLEKNEYFLLMARMEPENNIEMVLDGFHSSSSSKKFIVIGNTGNGFGRYLVKKFKNEKRIFFFGALFNQHMIKNLVHFSALYFHGHSVGGTNPSLLEAMAAGALIIAHDNPFNKCILKDNALYFKTKVEVRAIIETNEGKAGHKHFILNNFETLKNEFTWEKIICNYDDFFQECFMAGSGKRRDD